MSKKLIKMFWMSFALLGMLAAANVSAAAILKIDSSGILFGADAVEVGGGMYDVLFQTGSCDSVFSGCDTSKFIFTNSASAAQASQALLDQVFTGIYDTKPDKTKGCIDPSSCFVLTPTEVYTSFTFSGTPFLRVDGRVAENFGTNAADTLGNFDINPDDDLSIFGNYTYALWSVAPALPEQPQGSVPEPNMLAILSLGLYAMRKVAQGRKSG
jgi:hypothetical protein